MDEKLDVRCPHGTPIEGHCAACESGRHEYEQRFRDRMGPEQPTAPPSDRAEVWFEAWGLVVRERAITGDPSAIPTTVGLGGRGKSRGSPSDIEEVRLRYLAVERFLGRCGMPAHTELMRHIYADSIEEKQVATIFTFGDGSKQRIVHWDPDADENRGMECPAALLPPVGYASADPVFHRARVFNLARYEDDAAAAYARRWGTTKKKLLAREHARLLKVFAKEEGLL